MKRTVQRFKYLLFVTILILIPFNSYFPQNDSELEISKQFDSALNQFNSQDYDKAIESFNKIITDYDYNSKTTVSEFFKAKILLQLKQLEEFKTVADGFLEKYPDSRYI
jgi:outer membrane protein assembly factor BamD (BamD/ComL family)